IYPFAVIMNKRAWDKLPNDAKQAMDGMIEEQAAWTGEYMDRHVSDSIAWSKQEHQVEVITLSPGKKAEWNASLAPITENWIKKANESGLPGDQIVKEIKDLIVKRSAE
ncbi:MAG: C4-dicarboxylate ABC transporter substrate-binding protein, partial [Desulfobacterales bacterium]|nr:C4-dicarboxylate ABC transporter substrate-binding protein [Desulfobacterales bacterium]